jgi:UDP-N-acetylglucosamine 2-epimerase (non-hydrolysing)/GDP/UDP-N,N'-diacetylbacillosamine 2-epimerase (hydrolysing)
MTSILRILAVTGGRADWGYLAPPLTLLREDPAFKVALAVTGQHLVREGKSSLAAIREDGFHIDARLDMLLGDDSAVGVTKSLGVELIGIADVLARLQPNLLMILGDRYEILGIAEAALIARVPIAHLAGGDVTEGAFDDAIRHSITKMSHLHFVTNAESARRVRQLGEDPARIHNVGSTGLDRIRMMKPMPRDIFFQTIGMTPRKRNLLITFHPATLDDDSDHQCNELLRALDQLGPDTGLLFTGVNADPLGRALEAPIGTFVRDRDNALEVPSLGSPLYCSALSHFDMVVGNSSSGLYEAPSFRIPTVNIGERQKGRLRAASVIDCAPECAAILSAIDRATTLNCTDVINPYGDGYASGRILSVLKGIDDPAQMLKKRFFDVI